MQKNLVLLLNEHYKLQPHYQLSDEASWFAFAHACTHTHTRISEMVSASTESHQLILPATQALQIYPIS